MLAYHKHTCNKSNAYHLQPSFYCFRAHQRIGLHRQTTKTFIMHFSTKIKSVFWIVMLILAITSCKKDKKEEITPEPEPVEDIIVAENTKIVDETSRKSILSIDTVSYTITADGSSALLSGLKEGDILVDSSSDKAKYGYLRKVKSVTDSKNGNLTIETEQATLTDAVHKGSIRFRTGKLSMQKVERVVLAEGVVLKNLKDTDFQVFSMDYNHSFPTPTGTVSLSGHTELDIEFFFDFDWDFDWLALPPQPVIEKFETGVEINQLASILVMSENGVNMQERILLAQFYFLPWTFMLGPVPVVFVPRIELFVEMDGSITAVLTTSASESFTGRIGSRYTEDNGWGEIAEKDYQTDFVAPTLDAGASFTAHIGPEIALLLYGVAGPFANLTGCGQINASLYVNTGYWDMIFKVGSQAQVGVKIDILGFGEEWSKEFCLFEEVVFALDNEPFGNNLYLIYPTEGQTHLVGDPMFIQTSYTGETPDEVHFIVDGEVIYVDNNEPFEYEWDTYNMTESMHVLGVESYKAGLQIGFDAAQIHFKIPVWEMYNLAQEGLNESTTVGNITFVNPGNGWMTVSGIQNGLILKTEDGGLNWQQMHQTNKGLSKILMYNDLGEGIVLDQFGDVWETNDGGNTLSLLTYGEFNQPTFQWKDIFDLATNSQGEIVAVGKDTGIPYHYRIYRANAAWHDPTGYFEIPYPNEYGEAPKLAMNGNSGILYNVYDENQPSSTFFMTTTDGGVSWEGSQLPMASSSTLLHDAFMPGESSIWLAGEENNGAVIFRSEDAGQSWVKNTVAGVSGFSAIHFTSNDKGYATVDMNTAEPQPKVYQTNDGGISWEPMYDTRNLEGMTDVFFLGEDFGFVAGSGSIVFRYGINQ